MQQSHKNRQFSPRTPRACAPRSTGYAQNTDFRSENKNSFKNTHSLKKQKIQSKIQILSKPLTVKPLTVKPLTVKALTVKPLTVDRPTKLFGANFCSFRDAARRFVHEMPAEKTNNYTSVDPKYDLWRRHRALHTNIPVALAGLGLSPRRIF